MIDSIPLPVTDDPIDAPFWQATLRSQLVVQQCSACARYRFPPRPMCPHCNGMEYRWNPVSGRGRIWSFAAPQPPLLPAFAALVPYVTAVVELAEDAQLRMVGAVLNSHTHTISDVSASDVRIGSPVHVVFVPYADDVALPCWRLS